MAQRSVQTNIALVAVFAALIATLALLPPVFSVAGVPFAVQLIAVLLAPMVLGPWQGFGAVTLYLLAGAAGLPIFAGGRGGIGAFSNPSGGFLIGYALAAIPVGYLATLALKRRPLNIMAGLGLSVSAIVGLVVIYALGIAGVVRATAIDYIAATKAMLVFVPLDLVKAVIAAALALVLLRVFPRLLAARV